MPEILGYELMNEPWTGDFFEVYIKFQKTYKSLMDVAKVSHERSTDAIASRNLKNIFIFRTSASCFLEMLDINCSSLSTTQLTRQLGRWTTRPSSTGSQSPTPISSM